MPSVSKNPKMTVAERVSRYRIMNPHQLKLNRLKENVNKTKKRITNKNFDEETKMKAREKKRRQRAARKIKPTEDTANTALNVQDTTSADGNTSTQMDTSPQSSGSSERNRLVVKFPFPRSSRNSPQVIPEKDNLSTSTRLDSSYLCFPRLW